MSTLQKNNKIIEIDPKKVTLEELNELLKEYEIDKVLPDKVILTKK